MEQIVLFFESYGVVGLFVLAFIESIFSPILPDLLMIPMSLAAPEKAIYYSAVVTLGTVLGGFVGYGLGKKFGLPLVKKYVPAHHAAKIEGWLAEYGGWAVFLAAMAPIPYKFVSISSGVFRINFIVFTIASVLGRGKRFMIEGVLIYYYGPQAIDLMKRYSNEFMIGVLVTIVLIAVGVRFFRKSPQRPTIG